MQRPVNIITVSLESRPMNNDQLEKLQNVIRGSMLTYPSISL